MKEFKFKAWHNIEKRWASHDELLAAVPVSASVRSRVLAVGGDNWELVVCTKLKDIHYKEIYEEDIVQFRSTYCGEEMIKAVVKFNHVIGSFVFEMSGNEGFWRYDASIRDLEVIGNIYENPELFETE